MSRTTDIETARINKQDIINEIIKWAFITLDKSQDQVKLWNDTRPSLIKQSTPNSLVQTQQNCEKCVHCPLLDATIFT